MCLPLAAVAIAATIASTAMSAYGAYQQQKSANAAATYQAQISNRNAEIANMQANQAYQQGEVEVKQHQLQVSQLEGQQRAAAGGSGLLTDTGTNLKLTQDTQGYGTLDDMAIRANAARNAWAYGNESANYASEGALAGSRTSSAFGAAVPSLLSGASQLSGQLYQNKKTYG